MVHKDLDTMPPPWKSAKKPVVTRHLSVEVEGVFDNASDRHTSAPPRNAQCILEAPDGSDDDNGEDPSPGRSEKGKAPEESEAELGT